MPRPEDRLSSPRASSADLAILDTLGVKEAHLTSKQIHAAVRKRLPAVNVSTIYRSLERLVKVGQVSISDMGTGAAVYSIVAAEPHHHIVCQDCGGQITLNDAEVRVFFARLERRHGFKITTNHLILFGRCAHCRAET